MTNDDNPYETEFDEEPRAKQRSWLWVWLLVGGCLLPVTGCTALALFGGLTAWRAGQQDLQPAVVAFLDLAEGGHADEAYALAHSEWRHAMSAEDFEAFFRAASRTLGPRESLGVPSVKVHFGTGGGRGEMQYPALYANGKVRLSVTLMKSGDAWRVSGVHYGTDLFAAALHCDSCGHQNTNYPARFCSSCGEPMPAFMEREEPATDER